MNLILSDDADTTTTKVQFWLKHYGYHTLRINGNDEFSINNIQLTNSLDQERTEVGLIIKNKNWKLNLPLHQVDKYWYRRGAFNLSFNHIRENKYIGADHVEKLNKIISIEYSEAIKFLNFYLETRQCINSFNDNYINKLNVLLKAERLGLLIPPTLITCQKTTLKKFAQTYKSIITKAIWNGDEIPIGQTLYNLGNTALFDFKELELEIPDEFPISLFQAYIPKKYELRIFYLHEILYASCIFSQRDPKTRIDFREYNRENPNRVVPYKVPEPIRKNIIRLMKSLEMNSGSLDMVYGEDGNYYFLEVNPIGQFSQVSYPCNYYLEKEIASFLGSSKYNS